MNLASVLRYWATDTNGLDGPYCWMICSCFARTICNIANFWSLSPEPRPTLTLISYSFAHVLGSNVTYLPRIRTILGLSWYLPNRCKMPLNRLFTPVSAKIRAINSSLPLLDFIIAATAVAVTLLRMSGSSPCCASLTPVRLAWTASKYSSIGMAWPNVLWTVNGTRALGFLMRIIPPGVALSKSSMLTWPSTAPTRLLLVRYRLSKLWRVIVDFCSWISIVRSARLCPKNLCGTGIGQIEWNGT